MSGIGTLSKNMENISEWKIVTRIGHFERTLDHTAVSLLKNSTKHQTRTKASKHNSVFTAMHFGRAQQSYALLIFKLIDIKHLLQVMFNGSWNDVESFFTICFTVSLSLCRFRAKVVNALISQRHFQLKTMTSSWWVEFDQRKLSNKYVSH